MSSQHSVAKSNGGAGRESAQELRADFEQLREDLAQLRRDLMDLGAARASQMKSAAKTRLARTGERARDAADYASGELQHMRTQTEETVRNHPLTAVAAALAVGYFFSLIMRR